MEIKQKLGSRLENIKQQLSAHQANMWTSLPGAVVSFDPVKCTASVQPLIQGKRFLPDGAKNVDLPVLVDVPVIFTRAGGCTITVPINPGDEGIIIFSSRCIDGWWYNGSKHGGNITTSPQLEMRMHDLSDGLFFPGGFSVPEVIPDININNLEIRNANGTCKIALDPANNEISVNAQSMVSINCPRIHLNGDVTITGNVMNNGKNISSTHQHSGVTTGGGSTGAPI